MSFLMVWVRILSAKEMTDWKPGTNVLKIMAARDMDKSQGRKYNKHERQDLCEKHSEL